MSHKLEARANTIRSRLCIGLDPDLGALPDGVPHDANGVVNFCRQIIDATCDYALAFKPNTAFFEALGPAGWQALHDVRDSIPADIPVVIDGKRGDVGNTGRAYARALFETLHADAATVNPYLGPEGLLPFMQYEGRAVLVLARTSNPGADIVQEQTSDNEPMFLDIARWASDMPGPAEVGFVVGATQMDAVRAVRHRHRNALLLLPGVGTQGGDMASAVAAAGNRFALPAVSRQIMFASSGADFARAAGDVACRMAGESWTTQGTGHAGR